MAEDGFVHLHVHTEYSLLDGASRIKDLVARCAAQGSGALAITDHGAMYGVIPFVLAAREVGIKPIIGAEFYLTAGSRFDRASPKDEQNYHLVLLAENITGYRNLMKLVSLSYIDGYYYKPRIDREALGQHREGLIALTACLKGEAPQLLARGDMEGAERVVREYRDIFGEDHLFLELQDQGIPEQKEINAGLAEIASRLGLPLVATNDVHYTDREDHLAHDVLLCIQTNSLLDQDDRLRFSTDQFYLKSAQEMAELFSWVPEAVSNTREIARRCSVEIEFDRYLIPRYPVPEGHDADSYLEKLAWDGARRIYGEPSPEVKERLAYELSVIKDMGFSGYFLIVWDFVQAAKRTGIMVGPGRGSAAGSLVAYTLGITTIDPLKYDLLFERFLNPSRRTMPDMDIDFCYRRRPEVIQYVTEKYGSDRVAQIITFSTMLARAAIKDAGRVFNVEYGRMDKLAKMVPEKLGITIDEALAASPDLRQVYETDETMRKVIDMARKLEGLTRQDSIHAAGVVIADEPLNNYTPVQRKAREIITQYDMNAIQKIGLLKMDFLGLRTLTVIADTLNNIRMNRGDAVDLQAIPMDDPETYALLQKGDTVGVFQLESSGMRSLIRELRPSCFEDLIALLALYRPGPLNSGMVQDFVKRKHGEVPLTYPHPDLEPILRETYGIFVYQEQVMRAAVEMAGYSMAEADTLRGAIAKKKFEVLEAEEQKFIKGAVEKGYPEQLARQVFEVIRGFGEYGFNKSHSTAYAAISYQTAYLKAHYAVEFMAALLTSISSDQDKVRHFTAECRRMGIEVLPPDINESMSEFTPVKQGIRFGLTAIRNLGQGAVEAIIAERKRGGPFVGIVDFCERMDSSVLNRKALESLIKSGAFDSLGHSRRFLLSIYESAAELALQRKKQKEEGQTCLFGGEEEDLQDLGLGVSDEGEMPVEQLLAYEKESLGMYVTDHPVMRVREGLARYVDCEIAQLPEQEEGSLKWVGGIVNKVTKKLTRKGEVFAIFTLEDVTGEVEVTAFPSILQQFGDFIREDTIVCVKGRVERQERSTRITAIEMVLPNLKNPRDLVLTIRIGEEAATPEVLGHLKEAIRSHPGENAVRLQIRQSNRVTTVRLGEEYRTDLSGDLFARIKSLLGEGCVSLD